MPTYASGEATRLSTGRGGFDSLRGRHLRRFSTGGQCTRLKPETTPFNSERRHHLGSGPWLLVGHTGSPTHCQEHLGLSAGAQARFASEPRRVQLPVSPPSSRPLRPTVGHWHDRPGTKVQLLQRVPWAHRLAVWTSRRQREGLGSTPSGSTILRAGALVLSRALHAQPRGSIPRRSTITPL